MEDRPSVVPPRPPPPEPTNKGRVVRAWGVGLTRLYLVCWALWVVVLLVLEPAYVSHQARERARAAEGEYRAYATAGRTLDAKDALHRLAENRRTTLAGLYRERFRDWPDLLVPLLGFPLAVYAVLVGSILLMAWARARPQPGAGRSEHVTPPRPR